MTVVQLQQKTVAWQSKMTFSKTQETVGSVARGNLMVVMGDMNARVGCDVSIWGKVLGEEVCNENGSRLLQFSSEHNLWITNTHLVPAQKNSQVHLGM